MLFAILSNVYNRQEECQPSVTVRAKLSSPMHDTFHLVKSRTKISLTMQRERVGSVHIAIEHLMRLKQWPLQSSIFEGSNGGTRQDLI